MQAKTGQTNRNVTNNRAINLIEIHMKENIEILWLEASV